LNKLFKITCLGGRPYSIGGHDLDNPIRYNINQQIEKILIDNLKRHEILLGLSGLNIGIEQDFANLCLKHKININVYLSCEQMCKRWENLPHIQSQYDYLIKNALNVYTVNKSSYSPLKNYLKNLTLIRESDLIIYVKNPFKKNCMLFSEIQKLNKDYIVI
jgi:hypothetical protein